MLLEVKMMLEMLFFDLKILMFEINVVSLQKD